jgi:hypothetical protein
VLDKTVIFRYPKISDASGLKNLINSLVKEKTDIAKTTQVALQQEKAWAERCNKVNQGKKKSC